MIEQSTIFSSPLFDHHQRLGAQFIDTPLRQIVAEYTDSTATQNCALLDATAFARLGLKGADCAQWLQETGFILPDYPNQACPQRDQSRLLRLSKNEFWFMQAINADPHQAATFVDLNESAEASPARVYPMLRNHSHACLHVSGADSAELFSKLCAVDLRADKFANFSIAQTSLARVNAIIVRDMLDQQDAFFVLADISLSDYLWSTLLNAMTEFGGGAIGINDLIKTKNGR